MFQRFGAIADSIAFVVVGLTIAVMAPKLVGVPPGRRKLALLRVGGVGLALVGTCLLILRLLANE